MIVTMSVFRDHAMKELHELREQFGGIYSKKDDLSAKFHKDHDLTNDSLAAMETRRVVSAPEDGGRGEGGLEENGGEASQSDKDSMRTQLQALQEELGSKKLLFLHF